MPAMEEYKLNIVRFPAASEFLASIFKHKKGLPIWLNLHFYVKRTADHLRSCYPFQWNGYSKIIMVEPILVVVRHHSSAGELAYIITLTVDILVDTPCSCHCCL
ncbi:hypothetical protein ACH5RR_004633 [Cinchona calisaya]|uniref:Uncharacterized protein n=1 Tax=Cinchona calisaya TaxID=153742 RepID=A0ABD3AZ16_9GENT